MDFLNNAIFSQEDGNLFGALLTHYNPDTIVERPSVKLYTVKELEANIDKLAPWGFSYEVPGMLLSDTPARRLLVKDVFEYVKNECKEPPSLCTDIIDLLLTAIKYDCAIFANYEKVLSTQEDDHVLIPIRNFRVSNSSFNIYAPYQTSDETWHTKSLLNLEDGSAKTFYLVAPKGADFTQFGQELVEVDNLGVHWESHGDIEEKAQRVNRSQQHPAQPDTVSPTSELSKLKLATESTRKPADSGEQESTQANLGNSCDSGGAGCAIYQVNIGLIGYPTNVGEAFLNYLAYNVAYYTIGTKVMRTLSPSPIIDQGERQLPPTAKHKAKINLSITHSFKHAMTTEVLDLLLAPDELLKYLESHHEAIATYQWIYKVKNSPWYQDSDAPEEEKLYAACTNLQTECFIGRLKFGLELLSHRYYLSRMYFLNDDLGTKLKGGGVDGESTKKSTG